MHALWQLESKPAATSHKPGLNSPGFLGYQLASSNLSLLKSPIHLVTWGQSSRLRHVFRNGRLPLLANCRCAHSAIFAPIAPIFKPLTRTENPSLDGHQDNS